MDKEDVKDIIQAMSGGEGVLIPLPADTDTMNKFCSMFNDDDAFTCTVTDGRVEVTHDDGE